MKNQVNFISKLNIVFSYQGCLCIVSCEILFDLVYMHPFWGLSVCEGDWVKVSKSGQWNHLGGGVGVRDPKSNISRFEISRGWIPVTYTI